MSLKCTLCGEPMEAEESMFKYHGSLGPCPKPPFKKPVPLDAAGVRKEELTLIERESISVLGIVQMLSDAGTIKLPPELSVRIEAILLTASQRRIGV